MIPVTTVELFVRLFDHLSDAVEFESRVQQADRCFLPDYVLSVMACADPTPEYWQFLALQLKLLRCSFRTEVQGC